MPSSAPDWLLVLMKYFFFKTMFIVLKKYQRFISLTNSIINRFDKYYCNW